MSDEHELRTVKQQVRSSQTLYMETKESQESRADANAGALRLESHAVYINVDGCQGEHFMVSIRTGSDLVKFLERCVRCGWVDADALNWWVENAIKEQMNRRAQRIAVASETKPFSFVQSAGDEELTFQEILWQALGAASTCWVGGTGKLEFDGSRASEIGAALMAELNRHEERIRAR